MNPPRPSFRKALRVSSRVHQGFSLVEVLLALGIVAFAGMTVLATLPVGIQVVQDSRHQSARASIIGQLRGEFQNIPYTSTNGELSINGLPDVSYYFDLDGTPVDEADPHAYYAADFELENANIQESGNTVATAFANEHARMVQILIRYPLAAPEVNQSKDTVYLFSTRQTASGFSVVN